MGYERSMPSDNRGYIQSLTPAQLRAKDGANAMTGPQNNMARGIGDSHSHISQGSNYRNYQGNNSYEPTKQSRNVI